jgi:hypothetical protein
MKKKNMYTELLQLTMRPDSSVIETRVAFAGQNKKLHAIFFSVYDRLL